MRYKIHARQSYASFTFNNSDEIRTSVQHHDLSLLPCKNLIDIGGTLVREDGTS